jgi:phosphoribosylanthranilate isomerase
MTLIKNCGLKSLAEMEMAARTGASFIGFVHHAASPRHLDLSTMAALNMQKPAGVKSVAVTMNPSDALLQDIVTMVRPDYLQVHKVDAPRLTAIREHVTLPLIVGVAVRAAVDIAMAKLYESLAEHILLDAEESGSGKPFDWSFLEPMPLSKPWFLAGGLTPQNVAEAIRRSHAPMVDVSSGIEDTPGHKSLEKIAAFNQAVLNAAHG